jgi:Bacteriocin-protection, YdeI or OmpD-Associated
MMEAVIKKLRMPEKDYVLILNAPAQYIEEVSSLVGEQVHTIGQEKYSFVQLFVHSVAELEHYGQHALEALEEAGLLWIAYPKKSSAIKTDINRDHGWGVIEKAGFEGVSLISIDETWSAMRFRSIHDSKRVTSRKRTKKEETNKKDTGTIEMPEDLQVAFDNHQQAREAFEKLAPSYRRGFIEWVVGAKRMETRKKRIILTIEKVKAGMKAPYNKE